MTATEHIFMPELPIQPASKCQDLLEEGEMEMVETRVMHWMGSRAETPMDILICYKGGFLVVSGTTNRQVELIGEEETDFGMLEDLDYSTVFEEDFS